MTETRSGSGEARDVGFALDESSVRGRVKALLAWAEEELDLLSSAFRGCTDEQLQDVCGAQRVPALPPAYHEFLRLAGQGGVGSAMFEIFPGDDVDLASILPGEDWVGVRALAEQLAHDSGSVLDFSNQVVLRVHRLAEFEFTSAEGLDPPVLGSVHGAREPEVRYESVTAWIERGIGRAIKRRYPLRDAHFHP